MGSGKAKRGAHESARASTRQAETSARLAEEQTRNAREDREFQKQIYERLGPVADRFINLFQGYDDIERPDLAGQFRRDYADEIADVERNKQRGIAEADDYFTASGLGRTGSRAMGVGAITRGANYDRSQAMRRLQQRTSDDSLQAYYDRLNQRGNEGQLAMGGANILAGQQGVFNPQQSYRGADASSRTAIAGHGGASQSYTNAAHMPSAWGTALGAAGAAGSIASGGGFRNIWGGGRR